MPRSGDFILHFGDSWISPKLWVPVVNGAQTQLEDYFIRAQARQYPDEIQPTFEWTVEGGGIVLKPARVQLRDGTVIEDTGSIRLKLDPIDWQGKPAEWRGQLEIEIASSNLEYPDFRKTIESAQGIRVVKDSTR